MKRITLIITLILTILIPTIAGANQPSESTYLFPIAASANGAGGTQWKTELCVFNPWVATVRVLMGTFTEPGHQPYSHYVDVEGDGMWCTSDVINTMGLPVGHAEMLLVFTDDREEFFANSRIYNTAITGEYGQTVTPAGDHNPYGLMQSEEIGVFTGVKNYGTAGGAGYRTNFGVFNIEDHSTTVVVGECPKGEECDYYTISVPAISTKQQSFRNTMTEGVLLIGAIDQICAYTSTVNNRSGDAVFQGHTVFRGATKSTATTHQLQPIMDWLADHSHGTHQTAHEALSALRVRSTSNPTHATLDHD